MPDKQLSRLERVGLRDVWENEALNFTPWLAEPENIQLLGNVIGLELEVEAQEQSVGPFSADILCRDTASDNWVLIENQLERTDHTHLGQLMTYAAGLHAVTIVWIASRFTDEHRAAIDWLNEITANDFSFFGLEVELWRIGDSPAAPKFNIVSRPNDWSRSISGAVNPELTDSKKTQLAFWVRFRDYLAEHDSQAKPSKPRPQTWMQYSRIEKFSVMAYASFWDSESESYDSQELRVELGTWDTSAHGVFARLHEIEDEITSKIDEPITWHEPEGMRVRRLWIRRSADLTAEDQWPEYFEWLKERIDRFQQTFKPIVAELSTGVASDRESSV